MKKLDNLSDQQEQILSSHLHEIVDYILNNKNYCENLKVDDIKDDINWIYQKAGLEIPDFILITNSYWEEKVVINYVLNHGGSKSLSFLSWIWNKVWKSFPLSVFKVDNAHDALLITAFSPLIIPFLGIVSIGTVISYLLHSNTHRKKDACLSKFVWNQIYPQLKRNASMPGVKQIKRDIKSVVEEKVRQRIESVVEEKVRQRIESVVEEKVRQRIESVVEEQIGKNFRDVIQKIANNKIFQIVFESSTYWESSQENNLIEHKFGLPWNSSLFVYSYFNKIGVFHDADFSRYYSFLKKGIFSIQYFEKWCIVTPFPKQITLDSENNLSCIKGQAVEWRKSFDQHTLSFEKYFGEIGYFISGVYFSEDEIRLWESLVSQNVSFAQILSQIRNMERRRVLLSVIPFQRIIDILNAKLISSYTYDRTKRNDGQTINQYVCIEDQKRLKYEDISLYMIRGSDLGIVDDFAYLLYYRDPSTNREYFDFVDPDCLKIDDSRYYTDNLAERAMSWKLGISYENYIHDLEVET